MNADRKNAGKQVYLHVLWCDLVNLFHHIAFISPPKLRQHSLQPEY
jgi:hypothetical protein